MSTREDAPMTTFTFDGNVPASLPPGWQAGVTAGHFPWVVRSGSSLQDGFVEVKFKALGGRQDQAGGVVWRWQDGDNYYVARANALEDNVSLYYTERGRRNTLKYVNAPVPPGTWHRLRVEFAGPRIAVLFNGKAYIELEDGHIAGAGAVGVWTKADSVTAFDDFRFSAAAAA